MALATHTTTDWQALDSAHFLHPFTDHKALHATGSRIIEHADGIYLWAVSYTHLTLPTILLV